MTEVCWIIQEQLRLIKLFSSTNENKVPKIKTQIIYSLKSIQFWSLGENKDLKAPVELTQAWTILRTASSLNPPQVWQCQIAIKRKIVISHS